jgi:hypothetical protein
MVPINGMLRRILNQVFFPASVEKNTEEISQIHPITPRMSFHCTLRNSDISLSAWVIHGNLTVLKSVAIEKMFGKTNQNKVTTATIAMMTKING